MSLSSFLKWHSNVDISNFLKNLTLLTTYFVVSSLLNSRREFSKSKRCDVRTKYHRQQIPELKKAQR